MTYRGPVRGLLATRRADLEAAGFVVHPQNAWRPCSRCGQECGLTPSSLEVLATGVPLVCNACVDELEPGPHNVVMTPAQVADLPLIDRLNGEPWRE